MAVGSATTATNTFYSIRITYFIRIKDLGKTEMAFFM